MKRRPWSFPLLLLILIPLASPAFAQEASLQAPTVEIVQVGPIDTTILGNVAGLGETFTATQGTSEYRVSLNWTVYQQYLWGTFIEVTLYRNNVQIYHNTYPSTGFGYGWTTTYTDIVGPSKSYTYKLVRHCWDGALLHDYWQPTYTGSTSAIRKPGNLQVTNSTNSDKSIQMSWTNASDLTTYYRVYENGVQIATTYATSYTVNTTPAHGANWGVATYTSSYGNSGIEQKWQSTAAYHRPENFSVSEDTTIGYIRLGWTCVSDYATHYQIFRDDSLLTMIPASQKSYLDSAITPGVRYKYVVRSYNSGSGLFSADSDDRFGRAAFLNASDGVYEGRIVVNWTDFPTGYENELRLYRDGVRLDGVYSNQVEKNDETVIPGKIHRYVLDVVKDNTVVLSLTNYGFAPADGSVRGNVTTPSGSGGVKNVEMRAYSLTGPLNKSVLFDGVDDHVAIAPLYLNTNTLTMTAWIKRNGTPNEGAGILISKAKNTAAGLFLTSAGELRYNWNDQPAANGWSSGLIVPDGIWTFVALVVEPGRATLSMNDSSVVNAVPHDVEEFDGIMKIGHNDGSASGSFCGMISEVTLWKEARTPDVIARDRHRILLGNEANLAAYWRLVQNSAAGDYCVRGNNHGTALGGPTLASDTPPVWHYGMTLTNGSYTIARINWEEGIDVTVRPFKRGHGFKGSNFPQDSLVLPFTQTDHQYTGINFIDTTSIEVSGWVYLTSVPPYPLPGVKVLVNGEQTGEMTDSLGHYSTSVNEAGKYTVSMEYLNHGFVPHDTLLDVQDPVLNLTFRDTTKRILSGRVFGGCDNFLGIADLRIRSLATGYIDTTIHTDGTGNYLLTLPSQRYTSQLVGIQNEDSIAIISYFTRDTVDISEHDTTHNYVYHSPPIVTISDLPAHGSGVYDVPIVEQERTYAVRVDVKEKYGMVECPASSGTVKFIDFVGYTNPDSVIALDNGRVYYPLIPGYPTLAGGGPHPYQKQLVVETRVDKYVRQDTVWMLIRGQRPRDFKFSTVSPQIPLMILRDPPGDKSYSFITTSSSVSVNLGFSVQSEIGIGAFVKFKVGGGGEVPGVGSTGSWVGGEIEAKAGIRAAMSGSQQIKIQATQTLKTSDGDKIVGPRGDVFMGAALNILYALTDIVDYDTALATVVLDTGIVWNGNGFKTTYLYTESHIRNSVIPGLQELASVLGASPEKRQRDSADVVQNQIDVWQQVLDRNTMLKLNALHLPEFPQNISFSAGTNVNNQASITSTTAMSISLNLFIEAEAALGIGAKAGDFNEVETGLKVFAKLDVGFTAGTTIEVSNTVGFELADDDNDPPGDVFSVDILGDPVYCTPVFKLLGGTSSCPWEPGTLPREGVGLSMNTYVANGVAPEMPAAFDLYLYNLTQNNETRTYKLSVVQGSNPDGAIISVGGAVMGADELQFSLPPNQSDPQRANLRVSRAPGSVFDYENLKLHLYSMCDSQFDTSVAFSVHFIKPCSDVRIIQPSLTWIANASHSGQMPIVLKNYNPAHTDLQLIRCEYRPRGTTDWSVLFSVLKALLPTDSIAFVWDMSSLSEGAYELRAVTQCASDSYASRIHSGMYDHTAPVCFGSPQPADGSLDPGDDIKVEFTEAIDATTATSANITMYDITKGRDIPITILCKGDELVITPKIESDLARGDSMRVTIGAITDVFGNPLAAPIIWSFLVDRSTLVQDETRLIPTDFVLEQCVPNPFNPRTNIRFGIPEHADVTLTVYDIKGQEIARPLQRILAPGYYDVPFDGEHLSSGVYLYMLRAGGHQAVKKMVLLK